MHRVHNATAGMVGRITDKAHRIRAPTHNIKSAGYSVSVKREKKKKTKVYFISFAERTVFSTS